MEKLTNDQAAKLAQLSVKQQTSAAEIQRIMLEMQLRQWCVEKGIEACKSSPVWFDQKSDKTHYYASDLAEIFYDFVTTPLRDTQRNQSTDDSGTVVRNTVVRNPAPDTAAPSVSPGVYGTHKISF